MSGLVRRKITVKNRKGKTYQRSVMVRAGAAVRKAGRFLNKHKGKIAGAVALTAAAAYGLHRLDKHGAAVRQKAADQQAAKIRNEQTQAAYASAKGSWWNKPRSASMKQQENSERGVRMNDSKRGLWAKMKRAPLAFGSGWSTEHEQNLFKEAHAKHHLGTPAHHEALAGVLKSQAARHHAEGSPFRANQARLDADHHSRLAFVQSNPQAFKLTPETTKKPRKSSPRKKKSP